jgi:hypothetical protein
LQQGEETIAEVAGSAREGRAVAEERAGAGDSGMVLSRDKLSNNNSRNRVFAMDLQTAG